MKYKNLIIKIAPPVISSLAALILLLVSWSSYGFSVWYARNVYPVMVQIFSRFFNIFPFSVFELGLVLIPGGLAALLLYFIYTCARCVVGFAKQQKCPDLTKAKKFFSVYGIVLLYFLSFLFTFFVLNAGINYNRESFAVHVGITVQDSSVHELKQLYFILVQRAHELSGQIMTDEHGVFMASADNWHSIAIEAMRELHNLHGGLVSFFPRPRAPVLSRIMSYMRIGGFFSAWTIEAHYNGEMPAHRIPFIMVHELAHTAGHMREDEANFIAYLAGRNSAHIDFNYSAVYDGIVYVLNALHRVVDHNTYAELFSLLPDQLRRDMAANRAFWQQFEGPVSEMANRANDAYLRANRQADGVQSYGRMVDLMLAYYRDLGFLS